MTAKIENGKLLIELPIQPRPSNSGKTLLIASTGGAEKDACTFEGRPVAINVNAYVSK
jgi:hypothetical protein